MGKLRGNAFSRRTAFFALFSWVLMSACSASASGNADASSAVSDVSDLSVSVGDSSVVLKWVDPADENFSAVEISCDSLSVPSVSVSREIQSAVISNLADRTRYAFTVKAVNTSGVKSGGVVVYAKPFSGSVTLEVSFKMGTITGYRNIYAIWIEDSSLSFIQNLYLCTGVRSGKLTGIILPFWNVNRSQLSASAEMDAVTGATSANVDFTVSKVLSDSSVRKFKVYFEVDRSGDVNDWFAATFKDQPALLFSADVDLDGDVTVYNLSPEGWTPNAETENIVPSSPSGVLQADLRYLSKFKAADGSFGDDDSRSALKMVKGITLTVK